MGLPNLTAMVAVLTNFSNIAEIAQLGKTWNMKIDPVMVKTTGRLLPSEELTFGSNKKNQAPESANWAGVFKYNSFQDRHRLMLLPDKRAYNSFAQECWPTGFVFFLNL